jgi:GNAT superfamily N-acetyltransferase
MQKTFVAAEEIVYRRIQAGRNYKKRLSDGTFRLSSQAFSDPNYRPSVNRAELCNHDPKYTQIVATDGVVSLVTYEVRAIDTVVQNDTHGELIHKHNVDVEHVPEPENYSHAEIYVHPDIQSRKVFHRLIERLAQMASQRPWEIELQEDIEPPF